MRIRAAIFFFFCLGGRGPVAAAQEAPVGDEPCACDVTAGACDSGCACDTDCPIELSVDECADPKAGCQPEVALDDNALGAAEMSAAAALGPDPLTDSPDAEQADSPFAAGAIHGGCSADRAPPGDATWILIALALAFGWRARAAARVLIFAGLCACVPLDRSFDAAISDGPPADAAARFVDVAVGEAGFALARAAQAGGFALSRVAGACGDELRADPIAANANGAGLGFSTASNTDGTTPLTELRDTNGCAVYEADPDAIALYEQDGYTQTGAQLGAVWPPGFGAPDPIQDQNGDEVRAASVCKLVAHPSLFLFYAGVGDAEPGLLAGCPGEVAIGEKHLDHAHGRFRNSSLHDQGGRTALVLGENGAIMRSLLLRTNGVERTAALFRGLLGAGGYDYIVIDEITRDPNWADGATANRRLRQLLLRVPARKIIAYISLDLTTEAGGLPYMRDRRLLLRALKLRGRALALEDYLHTSSAVGGAAPSVFRNAADRVAFAVHGLDGAAGISAREITTLGLSMHTAYPQYNYLDWPSHDLLGIARQVNAVRHASSRTRAQRGLGFYFVGLSDITPSTGAPYKVAALIDKLHTEMLRFR